MCCVMLDSLAMCATRHKGAVLLCHTLRMKARDRLGLYNTAEILKNIFFRDKPLGWVGGVHDHFTLLTLNHLFQNVKQKMTLRYRLRLSAGRGRL